MYYSFTDGTERTVPDMCGYCPMDTGGNHSPNCPCSQPQGFKFWDDGDIRLAEQMLPIALETWPDYPS